MATMRSPSASSQPPRRRGRRPRRQLTEAGIVTAAVAIADADGLAAVSIRRLAGELDVPHMSIYGYFSSKDELLAAMADDVIGEILVPEPLPGPWREALISIAVKHYWSFANHPWLISMLTRRLPPGPKALAVAEQRARALVGLDLDPERMWEVQSALTDYILGFAVRITAGPTPADLKDLVAKHEGGQADELKSLVETARSRTSPERFEFGLGLLLDGIEGRFADHNSGE